MTRIVEQAREADLVSAGIGAPGARGGGPSAAEGSAAGSGQSARRLRDAPGHSGRRLSDSRHESSGRRRHAGDAWLHPHVSGGHRRVLRAGAGEHAGAHDRSAVQDGLARRRAVHRSAHAARGQGSAEAHSLTNVTRLLVSATQDRTVAIDWAKAERAFAQATGVPEPVVLRPPATVQVVRDGASSSSGAPIAADLQQARHASPLQRAPAARLRARILRPRSSIYRVSPWLRLWGPPAATGSHAATQTVLRRKEKRRGFLRGVSRIDRIRESNYFDCDFLNMRSIFSFVASQQAWLA